MPSGWCCYWRFCCCGCVDFVTDATAAAVTALSVVSGASFLDDVFSVI
jgi:hypothetical protein